MINPLKITKEQFDKRWDDLSETLRELLYSPEHAEIVQHICENNHLNDDKTGTVLGIVGGVIMGFVHAQDLDHQISRSLDINMELARSIASDIKERVLKRFENEIEDAFQPSLPSETKEDGEGELEERVIEITETGEKESAPISIPVENGETRTVPVETAPASSAPFMLHEEKKTETASSGKSVFRGFSIPLGFFKPKNPATRSDGSSVVKIEAPEKPEKRVVNYSELRTSLSPFEGQQSFININKPEETKADVPIPAPVIPAQTEPAMPAVMPTTSVPAVPEPAPAVMPEMNAAAPKEIKPTDIPGVGNILGTIKRAQPKVEGNVIDLS